MNGLGTGIRRFLLGSSAGGYAIALAALAAATLLRALVHPIVGEVTPFPTYFAAVVLVGWLAGREPALLTLFAGGLLANYLFGPQRGSLALPDPAHWTGLALYFLTGLGIIAVTDLQRRTRARAEAAERRFHQLFSISSVGVAIGNARGRVAEANPAFAAMIGYTPEEIAAGEVRWDVITPPEYAELDVRAARQLKESGTCTPYEKECVAKDGRRVPVLLGLAAIERDRRTLNAAFVTDLTPLRKAQEALRASEERFRTLAEGMPHMVWESDAQGLVVYQNKVWHDYVGAGVGTTLGLEWLSYMHPDDRDYLASEWSRSLLGAGAHVYDIEARIRKFDGSYRWFRIKGAPIRNAVGAIIRWGGTCTDIDDQKRAADALRRANEQKDQFLSMLAHELRNPLAPIVNAVQVLKLDHVRFPAKVDWAAELIDRQARHLTRLVDDLLDVARINAGRIQLRREGIELATLVRRAAETCAPGFEARDLQLHVLLPEEPVPVYADPDRVAQVLDNLLDNARKYTEPGGQVWLALACEDDQAIVRVRDTGQGIGAQDLIRIFELFEQVDTSLHRSCGGLGVGLSLVQRLVHMHGGSVEALSEGIGRGSEFVVRLPLGTTAADEADPSASSPAPVSPRRILIVDDNADAAASLMLLLADMGHAVTTAEDGAGALAALADVRPDLVLLDIGLPDMSGYEVAERLRASYPKGSLQIVALTGYGREDYRERSKEAGFDAHLVKPITYDALEPMLAAGPGGHRRAG